MTDATVGTGSHQGRYLTSILGLYVSGGSVGSVLALYASPVDLAPRRSDHDNIEVGGYGA